MKQSLQLKLGQQLTMTPQLQQAIRLLQLSTLDLQQEIQQALENNPLLEVSDEEGYDSAGDLAGDYVGTGAEVREQSAAEAPEASTDWSTQELDGALNLPDELPVDIQWDDLLPSASAPAPQGEDNFETDFGARSPVATVSMREPSLLTFRIVP